MHLVNKREDYKKISIAVFFATLFLFSFFVTNIQADGVQISIHGGLGYRATVYNPYNTSFTATLDVTNLFTHEPIEHAWWTCVPYLSSGYFRMLHGFVFLSAHVIALDKTATRNGILIGPFVIFGPYK